MDTRDAGRLGGKAGTGEAKRRYNRRFEAAGEWSGYTIREGRTGWTVEVWSRVQGALSGGRYHVPYAHGTERSLQLDKPINECLTLGAELVWQAVRTGRPDVRVLRKGYRVQ